MKAAQFYKIYFSIQDYLMILFGTLLYGFGFNAFILSNEIVTGGVSGICALIPDKNHIRSILPFRFPFIF